LGEKLFYEVSQKNIKNIKTWAQNLNQISPSKCGFHLPKHFYENVKVFSTKFHILRTEHNFGRIELLYKYNILRTVFTLLAGTTPLRLRDRTTLPHPDLKSYGSIINTKIGQNLENKPNMKSAV